MEGLLRGVPGQAQGPLVACLWGPVVGGTQWKVVAASPPARVGGWRLGKAGPCLQGVLEFLCCFCHVPSCNRISFLTVVRGEGRHFS